MYISIIILPFLSTFLVGLFGRVFGRNGAMIIANLFIFFTFLISMVAWYEISLSGTKVNIQLWDWFSLGILDVRWGFLFDSLTCIMLLVITSISSLVHLYSTSYMEEDPHIIRFMSYLSLFTLFMIILVTSDNFGQLFLGWEGVGVSSYLLINFWFTRDAANQAAIKAIIVNRFGDIGILLAILAIFSLVKSLDFAIIFEQLNNVDSTYFYLGNLKIHSLTFISIALFIGAVGKSAQMGLHTWLPDAMEGPTPVSALIHAATMVTAGVFILIRLSPILEYSSAALILIGVLGALTGFFAGTIGIFQNDLKRVIAYSTCSQLGYMVVGCGLSSYSVALFHLMNHAFFKALLFLSAGAVIHAVVDEQDMRKMGGLLHVLPYTFVMFIIGSLSLMGFPYTTGYYSKDVLLELAVSNYYVYSIFMYWLLLLGAGCTAFYSFRLIYLTFLSEPRLGKKSFNLIHDAPLKMGIVMLILCFGSIFVGYICKDMFLGLGSTFLGSSVGYNHSKYDYQLLEAEFLNSSIKLLPVIFSIISGGVAYFTYKNFSNFFYINTKFQLDMYNFFNKKWYFDVIYNKIFVVFVLNFGYYITFKLLDRGVIELLGPTGSVRLFNNNKNFFLQHNTGYIFKGVFIIIMSLLTYVYFVKNFNNLMFGHQKLVILYSYISLYLIHINFFQKKF